MGREPDHEKLDRESEAALVKAAQGGGTKALDELISAYWSDLQRMAYSFCRNPADAEDLRQDASRKLAKGIKEFKGDARFTTWAYSIVRSTFYDDWRKQQQQPGQVPFEAIETFEGTVNAKEIPSQAPEVPNGDPDLKTLAREAIANLDRRRQYVVTLHYIDGVPLFEVAKRLGISYALARKEASRVIADVKQEVLRRLRAP